jgi:hypothetical protein
MVHIPKDDGSGMNSSGHDCIECHNTQPPIEYSHPSDENLACPECHKGT